MRYKRALFMLCLGCSGCAQSLPPNVADVTANPISNHQNCRQYTAVTTSHDQQQTTEGAACLQANGNWVVFGVPDSDWSPYQTINWPPSRPYGASYAFYGYQSAQPY